MAPTERRSIGLLIPGLLLVGVGVFLLVAHPGAGIALFSFHFWPLFLILAGFARIAGYALGRKPRSPAGGAILIAFGLLFLLGTLQSELKPIQVYARYWIVLLAIVAVVHLIKYYSHRPQDGPQPRLFGPIGVILVILIVSSGIAAHRLSVKNPDVLSMSNLPALLHGLPPGASPRSFSFTDPAFVAASLGPAPNITISNKYGDVRVTGGAPSLQATITKSLRAWNEADAKEIADHLKLVVSRSTDNGKDNVTITAGCDRGDCSFMADLVLQAPDSATILASDSNGTLSCSKITGPLSIGAQGSQVEINAIKGNVAMSLESSDVHASGIDGDVEITGARQVKASDVTGSIKLSGNKGDIDIREVQGTVTVDAPLSRIKAQGLGSAADLKSSHASVEVSRAAGLSVEAPDGDVKADSINGNLNIASSNSAISVHSVSGNLSVTATKSSVTADSVHGTVDVSTSYAPIVIKNFTQGVRVRANYDPVTLVSSQQVEGDIDVETSNGDIRLVLPSISTFQFDGESKGGHVRSKGFLFVPFNDLFEGRASASSHLAFAQGFGGPKIVLKTSYRDIIVEGKSDPARTSQAWPPDWPRVDSRGGYFVWG